MSPTQHFLYPDTDPRHRKAVEEAVNAQESEPQDVLAEALDAAIARHNSGMSRDHFAVTLTEELTARGYALVRTPETLDVAGLRREIEALPDVNPTPTVDTGTATDWPMVKRADVLRLTRQARERELVDPSGKDPTPRFHDTYLAASPAPDPGAGVVERLQQALRVATHRPHDQLGDPVEGFPVCSVCGAIQTGAATEPADGLELCPDCEGTGYVRHSGDMHFRVGRSEPVGPAPGETT